MNSFLNLIEKLEGLIEKRTNEINEIKNLIQEIENTLKNDNIEEYDEKENKKVE